MKPIEVFAPAKINLTLHVTGHRDDGYHLLDSLVVFADIGDTLRVSPADRLALRIDGPEAPALSSEPDNLVLRAARTLSENNGAEVTLIKRLPVSSGIGGGSADAAAALRALSVLWGLPLPGPDACLALGADLPVCLAGLPCRMSGIGETRAALPPLPSMAVLLVNPRVAVSTPQVFRSLHSKANAPMPADFPAWGDLTAFGAWLAEQRNDLLPPAQAQQPVIGTVLKALARTDSAVQGMSGSGATCFALFETIEAAAAAEARIKAEHSGWWVASGAVRTGTEDHFSRATT